MRTLFLATVTFSIALFLVLPTDRPGPRPTAAAQPTPVAPQPLQVVPPATESRPPNHLLYLGPHPALDPNDYFWPPHSAEYWRDPAAWMEDSWLRPAGRT